MFKRLFFTINSPRETPQSFQDFHGCLMHNICFDYRDFLLLITKNKQGLSGANAEYLPRFFRNHNLPPLSNLDSAKERKALPSPKGMGYNGRAFPRGGGIKFIMRKVLCHGFELYQL